LSSLAPLQALDRARSFASFERLLRLFTFTIKSATEIFLNRMNGTSRACALSTPFRCHSCDFEIACPNLQRLAMQGYPLMDLQNHQSLDYGPAAMQMMDCMHYSRRMRPILRKTLEGRFFDSHRHIPEAERACEREFGI
jgi:hypothetical protein